ncbi:MAG: DUF4870 domain-containing protein [Bacteroidetes bacterium]|nr:DUF4870 domain-containing protein [Bacteroidota bacterium]
MYNIVEHQPGSYTNEEKLFALLSHLSIFIGGIILPIILWATQKDKSKFVAFHALQAIFYQLSCIVIYVILIFVFLFLYIFLGIGAGVLFIGLSPDFSLLFSILIVIGSIIFYAAIFIAIFGFMGYAIYVGVKAHKGELRKYPIIGNIIYKKVYKTY